jgi:hypothetical protein
VIAVPGWGAVTERRMRVNRLLGPAPRGGIALVARDTLGIQAQVPAAAELALHARVEGLTSAAVRHELLDRRSLVRTFGPRDTVHLLATGSVAYWLAARRAVPRGVRWTEPWGLTERQVQRLLAAVDDALTGRELTREELAREAAARAGEWAHDRMAAGRADLIGLAASAGVVCFGPPRGQRVTFVRLADWIGTQATPEPDDALRDVCRMYLRAYGPARPSDFAAWFGSRLLGARDAARLFNTLEGEVQEVQIGRSRGHMLCADVPGLEPPRRPSVRLLPRYDCYLLGSRYGRDHVVPAEAKRRLAQHPRGRYEGSAGHNVLIIDGVVAGMWEPRAGDSVDQVRVEAFVALDKEQRRLLEADAARLARFYGAGVELTLGPLLQPS